MSASSCLKKTHLNKTTHGHSQWSSVQLASIFSLDKPLAPWRRPVRYAASCWESKIELLSPTKLYVTSRHVERYHVGLGRPVIIWPPITLTALVLVYVSREIAPPAGTPANQTLPSAADTNFDYFNRDDSNIVGVGSTLMTAAGRDWKQRHDLMIEGFLCWWCNRSTAQCWEMRSTRWVMLQEHVDEPLPMSSKQFCRRVRG